MAKTMGTEADVNMLEKILTSLTTIIKMDHALEDFTLIPTTTNVDKNVSPIKYVPVEHCLGLESWCASHLFNYTQKQVFKLRKLKKPNPSTVESLNKYLVGGLLIQPEITTFWNIKRELFIANHLEIEAELKFTELVLSFKPKSYEAYTYRAFVMRKKCESNIDISKQNYFESVLNEELEFLRKKTLTTSNNYHGWNYRIWCVRNICKHFQGLYMELRFSLDWINTHVSEHSGFHYRQYLINSSKTRDFGLRNVIGEYKLENGSVNDGKDVLERLIGTEKVNRIGKEEYECLNNFLILLIYELLVVLPNLHDHYEGHEAIWYHRKYVVSHIYSTICDIFGTKITFEVPNINLQKDVNILDTDINIKTDKSAVEMTKLYKLLLKNENEFLELSKDFRLMKRYKLWLRCYLGFDV